MCGYPAVFSTLWDQLCVPEADKNERIESARSVVQGSAFNSFVTKNTGSLVIESLAHFRSFIRADRYRFNGQVWLAPKSLEQGLSKAPSSDASRAERRTSNGSFLG